MKNEKGLVHVYTGNGKGKTTAALGVALRSWGHGKRVCIIQFMKNCPESGEFKALKKIGKNFRIMQFGRGCFIKDKPTDLDKKLAMEGLEFVKKILVEDKNDLVILDELNCALYCGLLKKNPVESTLAAKPIRTDLVITGRYAPKWLTDKADLVTEMREKKHCYKRGVKAKQGLEF
jgi:cob(I)alamin adenosyltransferase